MSKLTNNYIAVQKGSMSQAEFLRQARQQFPGVVSQFNSYNDTLTILKNKGLLSEEVMYQCQGDRFPLEAIERGIEFELESMGIRTDLETPTSTEYKQAKKRAIDNLCKDELFYVKKVAVCCDKAKTSQEQAEKEKGENYKQKKSEGQMKPVKVLRESKGSVKPVISKKDSVDSKLLKESITKAITKILSEAATANLAQLSDQHASIQGIPAILNTLENIVTEIESFILKTQTKIQGAFDSIGDIRNEDNIPVGYKFVQPILESFKKDLEPVLQKASLDNLKLPTAPEQSESSEVDVNNQPELGSEVEEDPKQTVFAPKQQLAENKQPRKRYTA